MWNNWGIWSDCSVSCDTGSKSRDRTCNQDQSCPNGDFCDGPLEDTDQCMDNALGKIFLSNVNEPGNIFLVD